MLVGIISTHHSDWRRFFECLAAGSIPVLLDDRRTVRLSLPLTSHRAESALFSHVPAQPLDWTAPRRIDVLQALPYDDLVPYDEFVVYVPSSHPGRHVLDTLSAIPLDRIRSMRAALDKYSKYLLYAPTAGSGRPIHTEANLVRSTAELDAGNHTLGRQALLRRSQEEQVLAVRVLFFEIARRFAPEQRSAVGAIVA